MNRTQTEAYREGLRCLGDAIYYRRNWQPLRMPLMLRRFSFETFTVQFGYPIRT